MASSPPRAYRSSRRSEAAARTRARVLAAATTAFLARGYAGATVRAIAVEAGVSVPTVELLFGTKARLLKAAIDVAIAGDDAPVPVLERDWAREAAAARTAEDFLAVAARVIAAAQQRSAGLVLAVFEGSSTDPELAELATRLTLQRETTASWLVDALARLAPRRPGCTRTDAVDELWVLMDPAVFDRLTHRRQWTVDRYRRWFALAARRLLLADTPQPGRAPDMSRPGQIEYLQLPALDIARSGAFYEAVFGWSVDLDRGSFDAPGMIGQFATNRPPAGTGGPLLWIRVDDLWPTLRRVAEHGGTVCGSPQLDGGERFLVEVDDPAGNRIGVVVPTRPAQPQTLLAVRDVEAASRWYQRLLGLRSDHGGPHYERLLAGDTLVLQLHHRDVEHHHGRVVDPDHELGNGMLLWFGEVADFDDVVGRAAQLGASVVNPPHRNPPAGEGNGPAHREIWIKDLDGYTVVVASPDGEAYEPTAV